MFAMSYLHLCGYIDEDDGNGYIKSNFVFSMNNVGRFTQKGILFMVNL